MTIPLKEIDFDSSLNFTDPFGIAPVYDGMADLLFLRAADRISDWNDPGYKICISNKLKLMNYVPSDL